MKRNSKLRKFIIRFGAVIVGLAVLIVMALAILSAMETRPTNLGVTDGKLQPCGGADNCVCSEYADAESAMPPIPFEGTPEAAMKQLIDVISSMPRTTITEQTRDYLHVEFRSLIFRFTDDVEFRLDETDSLIHFRSASRVGKSDLGVNRHRMEQIRDAFNSATLQSG